MGFKKLAIFLVLFSTAALAQVSPGDPNLYDPDDRDQEINEAQATMVGYSVGRTQTVGNYAINQDAIPAAQKAKLIIAETLNKMQQINGRVRLPAKTDQ